MICTETTFQYLFRCIKLFQTNIIKSDTSGISTTWNFFRMTLQHGSANEIVEHFYQDIKGLPIEGVEGTRIAYTSYHEGEEGGFSRKIPSFSSFSFTGSRRSELTSGRIPVEIEILLTGRQTATAVPGESSEKLSSPRHSLHVERL